MAASFFPWFVRFEYISTPCLPAYMPVPQFRSAGPMTLNNYTSDELMHLRACVAKADSKIKYITWNEEVGENQTPHLQIYAQAFKCLSVKAWQF